MHLRERVNDRVLSMKRIGARDRARKVDVGYGNAFHARRDAALVKQTLAHRPHADDGNPNRPFVSC